ncbi:hypothetical protein [Pseudonocardia sp. WMMC193]|uniref:hypothetical protein n=1 Tax=Pseudonocardia sp. WMMC193 TaxID=2911965 RepID=UPI001F2E0FAE|nr:hypothetical protein [Pseudonocardia sp. WMMC193]MCF7552609.1 hypothetical protein [Pseudonocardia sp. WMMC193]
MRSRAIWLPGLAVALGAAAATAHGLYEVAIASRVPAGIAWLYPLITDGLALVAYAATARLTGSAARYAWAVVVTAAGLSGLAQAVYLASEANLEASPAIRFGVGAWPAVAAAVVAHLLYLLAEGYPVHRHEGYAGVHRAEHTAGYHDGAPVGPGAAEPAALSAAESAAVPPTEPPGRAAESPQRDHAMTVARSHAAEHGRLPTVSELQDLADVARGTAAKALRRLKTQSTPAPVIQLIRPTEHNDPPD